MHFPPPIICNTPDLLYLNFCFLPLTNIQMNHRNKNQLHLLIIFVFKSITPRCDSLALLTNIIKFIFQGKIRLLCAYYFISVQVQYTRLLKLIHPLVLLLEHKNKVVAF